MTQITNTNVDSLVDDVAAPLGPLVRVTNVNTTLDFDDNRDAMIVFTSALGIEFSMTYNQLNHAPTRDAILQRIHAGRGVNAWIEPLLDIIDDLKRYADTLSLPHTDAQAAVFINALRRFMPLVANPPNIEGAWRSGDGVSITQVITGTGAGRTATLTIVGTPSYVFTDWGDGNVDVGNGPHSNTYAADGVYRVRSVAIGPGGINADEEYVTVDVP